AQRVKLSTELSRRGNERTLYILDEPTTGLHFEDIRKLLNVLQRLRDGGSTVVVIEHNMDVIKSADYVIDLGPEGGEEGGYVVAEGTPEDIMNHPSSYTGQSLRNVLLAPRSKRKEPSSKQTRSEDNTGSRRPKKASGQNKAAVEEVTLVGVDDRES
ncbi:MAG TPA: excinuclease ABC subunit A, partial [Bacillota bacterium]|nr:excinuclease ABC subunit A [Bacillota bacterium]